MRGAQDGAVNVNIVQGEQRVTEDAGECVSTLLGSCVAACLHDPVARVGGMNHFLLPGGEGDRGHAERFSVHAMELLVNALLARARPAPGSRPSSSAGPARCRVCPTSAP